MLWVQWCYGMSWLSTVYAGAGKHPGLYHVMRNGTSKQDLESVLGPE